MNTALLKLNWPVLEAKLRQRYPALGADPLPWPREGEDELLHGIAKQVGRPRADIDQFLAAALGEILAAGNVARTTAENNERLGNPRGSRDLPPGAERAAMTGVPLGEPGRPG